MNCDDTIFYGKNDTEIKQNLFSVCINEVNKKL
jgi:hypothetical protein